MTRTWTEAGRALYPTPASRAVLEAGFAETPLQWCPTQALIGRIDSYRGELLATVIHSLHLPRVTDIALHACARTTAYAFGLRSWYLDGRAEVFGVMPSLDEVVPLFVDFHSAGQPAPGHIDPDELRALPTLCSLIEDRRRWDLVLDTGSLRYYIGHGGAEDGFTHRVRVDRFIPESRSWEAVSLYDPIAS